MKELLDQLVKELKAEVKPESDKANRGTIRAAARMTGKTMGGWGAALPGSSALPELRGYYSDI